jgi:hypothetical protein
MRRSPNREAPASRGGLFALLLLVFAGGGAAFVLTQRPDERAPAIPAAPSSPAPREPAPSPLAPTRAASPIPEAAPEPKTSPSPLDIDAALEKVAKARAQTDLDERAREMTAAQPGFRFADDEIDRTLRMYRTLVHQEADLVRRVGRIAADMGFGPEVAARASADLLARFGPLALDYARRTGSPKDLTNALATDDAIRQQIDAQAASSDARRRLDGR